MGNEMYADDYVLITVANNIQTRRPIRWCAWETICLVREERMFFAFEDMHSFVFFL
jgi:ketosteroid isomerase-like protein